MSDITDKIRLETVKVHFSKSRLKLIKITKILRVATLLSPLILTVLTPLEYYNFKWIVDTVALIALLGLLFWLIFSIVLYYYRISYSVSDVLLFDFNNRSIEVTNSERSNNYSIREIKVVYSTKIRFKINILISNYLVHDNFIYLFVYLNNDSHLEFCVEKTNPQLANFVLALKREGIDIKEKERFTLFS